MGYPEMHEAYKTLPEAAKRRIRYARRMEALERRAKRRFLDSFERKGDVETALLDCGRQKATALRWDKEDADFHEEYDLLKASWKRALSEKVESMGVKAVRRLDWQLDHGKNEGVSTKLAWDLAERQGLIPDKAPPEGDGLNAGAVTVIKKTLTIEEIRMVLQKVDAPALPTVIEGERPE